MQVIHKYTGTVLELEDNKMFPKVLAQGTEGFGWIKHCKVGERLTHRLNRKNIEAGLISGCFTLITEVTKEQQ